MRILLVITVAVLFFSCAQEQQNQATSLQVKVVDVVQKDVVEKVDYVGQVYGYQDISIRARVAGFLEGIHFNEGLPVKKGQLLYTIDAQPYEAEVAAKQSQVAEAKSVYAKAQSDLNRYKPLAENNAVSQADLDGAQVQFEAAESQVKAAEANLEIAQIQLGYTKVYSPIDGIIGKSIAKVGDLVGQAPLVVLNTVSKTDVIHVDFFLPENQYLQVVNYLGGTEKLYQESGEHLNVLELVLADNSIHKYKGAVNFIDRGVDSNTGTILIQTRFPNPDLIIRPGQYAKVRIPLRHQNAIVIPQKCVKELQGQYSVFIVNSENKIETRQIVSGGKVGDMWLITDGLNPGDKVLIEGLQKVRNGMPVVAETVEFKSQFANL
ncbi:efflux RND transporter periplasmic adaptor subunit [Draconibacterium sp. IB214405]|uniref:efflux RND transporter periplasmic adaptor subunit n=1 Tax=Draconibacterium sp. IB214405 TaxID=3097352 RepID=UPI002A1843B7|nr:efflux RND transporter periplasmic adaptor subunit [Draconibacterium sp. IB214405]MDX8339708.1 efflux RND transporter periplasmic adaptor subunit [Draconibacterium sp. IB214405]